MPDGRRCSVIPLRGSSGRNFLLFNVFGPKWHPVMLKHQPVLIKRHPDPDFLICVCRIAAVLQQLHNPSSGLPKIAHIADAVVTIWPSGRRMRETLI